MILSEADAGHGKGPQRARDPKILLPGHGNPLQRARHPLPQRKFVEGERLFVERADFSSKGCRRSSKDVRRGLFRVVASQQKTKRTRYETNHHHPDPRRHLLHGPLRPAHRRQGRHPRRPHPPGRAGGRPAVLPRGRCRQPHRLHHHRPGRRLLAGPDRKGLLYALLLRHRPPGAQGPLHPGRRRDPRPGRHPDRRRHRGPRGGVRDRAAPARQDGGGPDDLQRGRRRRLPDRYGPGHAPQGPHGHRGRPGQHHRQRLLQLPGHRGRQTQPDVLRQPFPDLQDDAGFLCKRYPGDHEPGRAL